MLTERETGQSRSEAAVGMCELGEGPFGEAEMWRLWMVLEENEVMAVCLCKQYLGAGAGFDILPQLRKIVLLCLHLELVFDGVVSCGSEGFCLRCLVWDKFARFEEEEGEFGQVCAPEGLKWRQAGSRTAFW